jgi:hypothetical protein
LLPDIYLEPWDARTGACFAPGAVYVCPVPFLVFRWQRKPPAAADSREDRLEVQMLVIDRLHRELREARAKFDRGDTGD